MTRLFRRRSWRRPGLGPTIRPSRGVVLALGLCGLLALALIPVAVAQSRRVLPNPGQPVAVRLFNEGKYDEVVVTLQKADTRDASQVALLARALSARGKYQEAEAVLRPAVERDPGGEVALELGLLLQMFARPEAETHLRRVAGTVASADTPRELARAARALRALGEAQEANGVYRDAAACRAARPGHQHGVGRAGAREVSERRRAEVVQDRAARLTRTYVPALIGSAQSARGRQSAGSAGQRAGGAQDQSEQRRCARVSRQQGGRRGQARRGEAVAREGAGDQSEEPRGAVVHRRPRLRRGPQGRLRRGSAARAGDRAEVRRGVSRRRRAGGAATTASTKRRR